MIIRPASFRDLARIELLYRDSLHVDEPAGQIGADSPVPQATLLRVWHAVTRSLSSLMPMADSDDALLVAEDTQEGVIGFIQAQSTSGKPRSWQVLNLCTAATAAGHFAREQLVGALCNHGMEHGVHRFHVRLPLDHPLVPVFLGNNFTQLATEQVLYRDQPPAEQDEQVLNAPLLRPARRDDIPAIHLLYLRTTPSQIAAFEGPSLKAWQSFFAQGAVGRMGRDDIRHYVVERPGVSAWAAMRPATATRPAQLMLMCEGQDATLREPFVDAVLRELPPGPTSCMLRHYDSELIRALQQRGFAVYGTQLLLVCELKAKVRVPRVARRKQPVLVTAGIARAVPLAADGPVLGRGHAADGDSPPR